MLFVTGSNSCAHISRRKIVVIQVLEQGGLLSVASLIKGGKESLGLAMKYFAVLFQSHLSRIDSVSPADQDVHIHLKTLG